MIQDGSNIRLDVSGNYRRPDAPDESLVGSYQAEITPTDAITISYDYAPTNAKGHFSEAGLTIVLPPELTELHWIGQGPFAGYPGKDRLNEFGVFHLNRDDLRFQGNRRETEVALVTSAGGGGVALVTANPTDIAVERDGKQTLLSHNAVIGGLGNKGTQAEVSIDAKRVGHITGSFTLVPLDDAWPAILTRWFGNPASARDVFRPYYLSYDQ